MKENKWFADEGYYSNANSLGITNMYFLQQKDLDEEAKGRITLGPLECVETSKKHFLKALVGFTFSIITFNQKPIKEVNGSLLVNGIFSYD